MIDGGARKDIHVLVTEALKQGATVATGGGPLGGGGYFYAPTALANVPNDATILKCQIFGPVARVTTFRTEDEAIRLSNASEYGLASYLITSDHSRMLRVAEQIEFGGRIQHRRHLQRLSTLWRSQTIRPRQ